MQLQAMQMLTTRDQEIVLAREEGATTVALGQRFAISHQRVSVVIARATEIVNQIDLDLMVARKTDEVCAYVIPFGPDYTLGLDFSSWLIKRLRDRGIEVDVETRRTLNGLILLLSDATPGRAS